MAKRGILEHPKTIELAERLGLPECYAVGVLESLWHHVARYYPQGDISPLRPAVLARSIRYPGDAAELWEALFAAGFLERDGDGRVLVHDWSEHADNAVHQLLKKRGAAFADGCRPFSRERPRPAVRAQAGRKPQEQEPDRFTPVSQTVHEPVTNGSRLPEPEPKPEPESNVDGFKYEEPARSNPPARTSNPNPPDPLRPGREFMDENRAFFNQAVGFCPDKTALIPLLECLTWHLENEADLSPEVLTAGLFDARNYRDCKTVVSPKSLAVGITRASEAATETNARLQAEAAAAAAYRQRERAEAEADAARREQDRIYRERQDRAALAGPGSPEWEAWLAEMPGSRTHRDMLKDRRSRLLARQKAVATAGNVAAGPLA